jgi:hypothetical protein
MSNSLLEKAVRNGSSFNNHHNGNDDEESSERRSLAPQFLPERRDGQQRRRFKRNKNFGGLGYYKPLGGDKVRAREYPMAIVTACMVSAPSIIFLIIV